MIKKALLKQIRIFPHFKVQIYQFCSNNRNGYLDKLQDLKNLKENKINKQDLKKEQNINNIQQENQQQQDKLNSQQENGQQQDKLNSQQENNNQQENQQDKNQQQNDQQNDKQQNKQQQYSQFKQKYLEIFGISIIPYLIYTLLKPNESIKINYKEFKEFLDKNRIKSIKILSQIDQNITKYFVYFILDDDTSNYIQIDNINNFLENLEYFQTQNKQDLIPITIENRSGFNDNSLFLSRVILIGMSIGVTLFIFKNISRGSKDFMQTIIGSKKWKTADKKNQIKFQDVAGQDEAKKEISEFVDFLKNPKKYHELGARLPKGALLTGPPGTGKTLLAKACAGESGVPFFYLSGSDFVEMFVGVGAQRVRDLFKEAKSKSPSIIFIDEIDAIGKKRQGSRNEERDNTLNQLLVEMDGFNTDQSVIVMAATNRIELLDTALTRPGRFDRQIEVSLPDLDGRFKIFQVHLQPLKLNPEKSLQEQAKRLATLTPGFSGADISNLCNESAILAARGNKQYVQSDDFEKATERILAGYEKSKIISEKEKKTVAYHESGHAIVSWFLKGGAPLLKLTIIPRSKGSLGFAQYLPNESSLYTQQELEDQICVALGGRISEEHFFKQITTGASDDLQKVHKVAEALVTKFGMNDQIGNVGFQDAKYYKTQSEETQNIIDQEIFKLVQKCTLKTRQIINQYEQQIIDLSERLLEKETLDLQEIIQIIGERPFQPKQNYKEYLNTRLSDQ